MTGIFAFYKNNFKFFQKNSFTSQKFYYLCPQIATMLHQKTRIMRNLSDIKEFNFTKTWRAKSDGAFLVLMWKDGESKIWSGHKSEKLAIRKQNSENKGAYNDRYGWVFEAVINK